MVNRPRGNTISKLRTDRGGPAYTKDSPGQQYTNILQFSFHQSRSVALIYIQTQNTDVFSKEWYIDVVGPTNESNSQSNASHSLKAGKAKQSHASKVKDLNIRICYHIM